MTVFSEVAMVNLDMDAVLYVNALNTSMTYKADTLFDPVPSHA